jgi:GT2 family glycosyltransferase
MTLQSPRVSICIVSHNSASDLADCLACIGRLAYGPLEIVLVDCASEDDSVAIARRSLPDDLAHSIVESPDNLGFSGGMNRALEEATGAYVLSLNPDTRPAEDFVDRLVARAEAGSLRVGAVTGRLIRLHRESDIEVLDACGMVLTWTWRHLDRGSGRPDRDQWTTAERVFGATGAATLLSRSALEDVAIDGQVFDADFHSYREDAELCFRLRERGWEILYEPLARCGHGRSNLPERRRSMPAEVNFNSLKNRYLLRAYHQDLANFLVTLVPSLFRDLTALGYVLATERSSLRAYSWLWDRRRQILARRREIFARRSCSWWDLNRWFIRRRLPLK